MEDKQLKRASIIDIAKNLKWRIKALDLLHADCNAIIKNLNRDNFNDDVNWTLVWCVESQIIIRRGIHPCWGVLIQFRSSNVDSFVNAVGLELKELGWLPHVEVKTEC